MKVFLKFNYSYPRMEKEIHIKLPHERALPGSLWLAGLLSVLVLLCCFGMSNSCQAAELPSDEVLQGWLHKQVDEGRVSVILPIDLTNGNVKLSHALLDALWKEPNYRTNLQRWLNAPHASVVAEELLRQWRIRLHYALVASFEYLDRDSLSVMWRLAGGNAVYDLKRSVCDSNSAEAIGRAVRVQHGKLLAGQAQRLARQLPIALDLEYARQNLTYLADRPEPKAMSALARKTLQAAEAKRPAEDVQRIENHFTHATSDPMSPREACEVGWVTSHVVNDFTGEQPDQLVSGTLMRLAIISSAYSSVFARLDAPVGGPRPVIPGFTVGRAAIAYPELTLDSGVRGDATYRIKVDETGHAIDIVTLSSTVEPEQLHSIDGSTIATGKLLVDVIYAYVRSGFFEMKSENGGTVAFTVDLDYHWQSDAVKR